MYFGIGEQSCTYLVDRLVPVATYLADKYVLRLNVSVDDAGVVESAETFQAGVRRLHTHTHTHTQRERERERERERDHSHTDTHTHHTHLLTVGQHSGEDPFRSVGSDGPTPACRRDRAR